MDTQALVWMQTAPHQLTRRARTAVGRAYRSRALGVASIALWELAMLMHRGQLEHEGSLEGAVTGAVEGLTVFPITPAIAAQAAQLGPEFPGDSADRIIAATALVHRLELVTADRRLRGWRSLRTIW